jgi:hypothetical protein
VENSVDGRIEDLRAKGIEIVSSSGSDGDAVKTAIIKDPDGNQIVFAQGMDDIHRSTMQHSVSKEKKCQKLASVFKRGSM